MCEESIHLNKNTDKISLIKTKCLLRACVVLGRDCSKLKDAFLLSLILTCNNINDGKHLRSHLCSADTDKTTTQLY